MNKSEKLLSRLLNRMKLINGDDSNCCHIDAGVCPNHALIHEVEEYLSQIDGGK